MEGNGVLYKYTRNGYIILADTGENLCLPYKCYKGVNNEIGTRVSYGITKDMEDHIMCLDAMECVNVNELKYLMFLSIEDGRMIIAATAAWAIYDKAPEPFREEMRSLCIRYEMIINDLWNRFCKQISH